LHRTVVKVCKSDREGTVARTRGIGRRRLVFFLFDLLYVDGELLYVDGEDLMAQPLIGRKTRLRED
jgi:ATP-dependent DNA ligase